MSTVVYCNQVLLQIYNKCSCSYTTVPLSPALLLLKIKYIFNLFNFHYDLLAYLSDPIILAKKLSLFVVFQFNQNTFFNILSCISLLLFFPSSPVHFRRCERLSCPTNSLDCQNSPVRITYYQLSFQTNIIIPAQIFRIGPSPAYAGDNIVISITKGNEDGYFSTRKLNSFTGAVYLQRKVSESKEFLIDVQMKLLRQGKMTLFLARIYVFITSNRM